jgi:hypothetical protein
MSAAPARATEFAPGRSAERGYDPDMSTDWTNEPGLVPQGVDTTAISPFIDLTLTSLRLLSADAVVEQYVAAEPEAHRAIRELSATMAAAAVQVRDSGQMHDSFDDNLRLYTAEEIWMFDLAIDVVAMLGTLGGLTSGHRVQIIDNLKSLDDDVRTHRWKKEVHRAGDGPPQFRDLRAHVPHHQPHPA